MKRLAGVMMAGAVLAGSGLMLTGTATAVTPPAAPTAVPGGASMGTAAQAAPRRPYRATDRFAREFSRHGDRDASAYDIEHVRELQYRLRWAGAYRGPISGIFGDRTRDAVKSFQKRAHLKVTGTANVRTWQRLIPRTVRGRGAVPDRCHLRNGWHICYDRTRHQVTLWRRGKLWNSWLVRGGDYYYATRTGHFSVFSRDRDHISGLFGSPMPYSQFFSGGQAFHGSGLMLDPFVDHSHGCVNMYIEDAHQLWRLTSKVRLKVHVYGAWD